MNKQIEAVTAHNRRKGIILLRQTTGKDMVALAKELYLAQYHKDCESLGFETFEQLVSAPVESGGYGLTIHSASKLISVWKHYVVGGVCHMAHLQQDFDVFKLYNCRKYLTTPQEFEKRIHLSMSDIEKEAKGVNDVECGHPHIEEVTRWGCPDCGYSWKQDPRLSDVRRSEMSEQIDEIIDFFMRTFDLNLLDDPMKRNRIMAKLCLQKFGGLEMVKKLIIIASKDKFWQNKLTCFRHLYKNGVQIAATLKQKPNII